MKYLIKLFLKQVSIGFYWHLKESWAFLLYRMHHLWHMKYLSEWRKWSQEGISEYNFCGEDAQQKPATKDSFNHESGL